MKQCELDEAGPQLAELVKLALTGEPVYIMQNGTQLVRLVAVEKYTHPEQVRRFGTLQGKMIIPDDFDRMDEDEIAKLFGAAD
jgi:prevent-host-death family protein